MPKVWAEAVPGFAGVVVAATGRLTNPPPEAAARPGPHPRVTLSTLHPTRPAGG
jgi:hypothetical protein